MRQKTYIDARDAAWQLLITTGADELPIKVKPILKQLGVKVCSYKNSGFNFNKFSHLNYNTDGFTAYDESGYIILFDDSKDVERQRFTIAHEIGHIILGHLAPHQMTAYNSEPFSEDNEYESAANVVAARILSPSCVLHFADIVKAEDIAKWCKISPYAAQWRAERIAVLRQRGKFLISPLEREVYRRFIPFITTKNPNHRILGF